MQLIAHRGLTNNDINENTMDAYINAIKNGYDGIELDVRLTKDNNIVCLHDKLINRTSDGKGNINDLTYKELLKYNFDFLIFILNFYTVKRLFFIFF